MGQVTTVDPDKGFTAVKSTTGSSPNITELPLHASAGTIYRGDPVKIVSGAIQACAAAEGQLCIGVAAEFVTYNAAKFDTGLIDATSAGVPKATTILVWDDLEGTYFRTTADAAVAVGEDYGVNAGDFDATTRRSQNTLDAGDTDGVFTVVSTFGTATDGTTGCLVRGNGAGWSISSAN